MRMRWYLRFQQRHGIRAPSFAEIMERKARTLTRMHRSVFLHVREREIRFTVAAVGGAKQREESGVLRDGHELAVAKRPSSGREIERKDTDFSKKRICHN